MTNPSPQPSATLSAHAAKSIWGALKCASPDEYRDILQQGIEVGDFTADQALGFPMSRSMEGRIGSLTHKNPNAPDYSRDDRMVAWFAACEALGASPMQVVARMGEHASGGFARLVGMKCFEGLFWWRARGVEMNFPGPHALNKEPTTLATIAFLQGSVAGVEKLLPGSCLTHFDALWRGMWSRNCIDHVKSLTQFLEPLSQPPKNCMLAIAASPINLGNVEQVLDSARRLIEAGFDPNISTLNGDTPLVRAMTRMTSPAGMQLVDFLLANGADPLAQVGQLTVVEIALEHWVQCTTRSHLRPVRRHCFMQIAKACPQDAIVRLFTPDRIKEIEERLRSQKLYPSLGTWSPEPDISALTALWLELATTSYPVKVQSRVRL